MGDNAQTMVVRELLTVFGVGIDPKAKQQTEQYEKSITATKDAMLASKNAAGAWARGITDLIGWLVKGTMAAVGFGTSITGALVYQANATSDYALAIDRQSAALGLSTDAYQEYRQVLGLFGVDQRDVADLFSQIAQQAQRAQAGDKTMVESFRKMGISVDQLKGKDPGQLFEMISEGLSGLSDDTQRLGIAGSLLGEDLTKRALPAMVKGAKGLQDLRKQARDTGVILDKDTIDKAKRLTVSMGTLGLQIEGVRNQIGAKMIPVVADIVDTMTHWIDTNRKWIGQNIESVVGSIAFALERGWAALRQFNVQVERLIGWGPLLGGIAATVGAVAAGFVAFEVGGVIVEGLWATFEAVIAISEAMAALELIAAPLTAGGLLASLPLVGLALAGVMSTVVPFVAVWGAAAAILAAVGLYADDLNTYLRGGTSVIGAFVDAWSKAEGPLGEIARLFIDIKDVGAASATTFAPLAEIVRGMLPDLEALLGMVIETVKAMASPAVTFALTEIAGAIWLIRMGVEGLAAAIRGLANPVRVFADAWNETGLGGLGRQLGFSPGRSEAPGPPQFPDGAVAALGGQARGPGRSVAGPGAGAGGGNVFNITGSNAKEIADEVLERQRQSTGRHVVSALAGPR